MTAGKAIETGLKVAHDVALRLFIALIIAEKRLDNGPIGVSIG